ncbi:MAG: FHA domain-containing protein [Bacteroidaceae bacterium]|nr:FHA domain-containing protein [Bacteroidaceae bacterium]
MDYIIGREPGGIGNRLRIVSQSTKQEYFVSTTSLVPNTVSREHCLLSVNPQQRTTILRNLKPQNSTWVNGVEITNLGVSVNDRIELGPTHYPLELKNVLEALSSEVPKTYSITHLKGIWDKYQEDKDNIQIRREKSATIQSITGILSMTSIACGFIPGIPSVFRVLLYVTAIILAVVFFIYRFRHAGESVRQLRKLDDQFHHDYVCPNPSCKRFLGYIPYDDLVKSTPGCPMPHCKAIYSTEK